MTTFRNLEKCILSAKEANHTFIVAEDLYQPMSDRKVSKCFNHFASPQAFWEQYKDVKPEKRAFYEIIQNYTTHRLYADLEWSLEWKSVKEIKTKFLELMKAEGLLPKKFRFLDASNSDKNKGSLHVVADYWFADIEAQSSFWLQIKNKLYQTDDWLFVDETPCKLISKTFIDFAVYDRNRQFRMPYSSKMNSEGKLLRPLLPGNDDDFNIEDYVISFYEKGGTVLTPTIYEDNVRSKDCMYDKQVIDNICSKYGLKINKVKGNMIICKNAGSNRICPINKEDNISDNAYLLLKPDGVYYHCHNEDCKGRNLRVWDRNVTTSNYSQSSLPDKMPYMEWNKQLFYIENNHEIKEEEKPALFTDFKNKCLSKMNQYVVMITGFAKPVYAYRVVQYGDKSEKITTWNLKIKANLTETFEEYMYKGKSRFNWIEEWYEYSGKAKYSYIDCCQDQDRARDTFNIFNGIRISQEDAITLGNEKEGQKVLDFIKLTWCNNDDITYDYVIKWLASQVQRPFKKLRKAIVLKSCEGAGKGSIYQLLTKIIGDDYTLQPTSHEEVLGQFNYLLRFKSFCFIDEMTYGGNKKEDGLLKKLITEPTLTVNEKHLSQTRTPNRINFLFASNNDWIIPVGHNARRYVVLELGNGMTTMTEQEKKEIYDCNPYSFAKCLYNIDLTDFDDSKHIYTEALASQKEHNLNDTMAFLMMGLKGYCDMPYNKSTPKDRFYGRFKALFPNSRVNVATFWKEIRQLFGKDYFVRKNMNDTRQFIVPTEEIVKKAMIKTLSLPEDYFKEYEEEIEMKAEDMPEEDQ